MFNAITWFEIPAVDFDRAVSFYSRVVGKDLRKGEFGGTPHGFFPSDEEGVGGAVVLNPHYTPSDKGVVIYLDIGSDLNGALKRVESSGGKILMPRTDIGEQGVIAIVQDTEGNQVGLHQPPQ